MRRLQLADQFHAKGFSIVGLQETRTRDAVCRPSGQFTCWSAAADKGNGGLELWVHNSMAPDVRTAVVLVSQSRLLVVRLSIALGEVCCFVLHAPDAVAGEAAIRAWWRASLAALRLALPGGVPVLLFADANGRVGAQASPRVPKSVKF
jgi:hypothetical protein